VENTSRGLVGVSLSAIKALTDDVFAMLVVLGK